VRVRLRVAAIACALAVMPAYRGWGQQVSATPPADATIDLLVPDDIKPTGQHGTVILEGDVSPEGRVLNPVVTGSSRAPLIDARAQKLFSNAKIAPDLLAAHPNHIRVAVAFYGTRGLDFGSNFSCAQAVLDADWYASIFPQSGNERTPLYRLIAGGGLIGADPRLAFATDPARYDRVWTRTIEQCRTTPGTMFLKALIDTSKEVR